MNGPLVGHMAVPSDHDIILALGEDLPVGIWVARVPNGELVYANRTFAQIMGMDPRGDVQAGNYSHPYGIYTRDGALYPEHRLPFARALEEQRDVVVDDIAIHRPDGTQVCVRAFARPVGNPATHVIVAFFDITREIEAEHARAESERRLDRAQRLEAIGNLAGGIAHDFNNLIFGVKLIAGDLAATEVDPKRRGALALIDDITERSATLTRSLLGFARRGKHRAVLVGLNDIVDSMAELLRRTLTGIELDFQLAAGDRGAVIGDRSQLEQVILNLVVNARDAVGGTGRVVVRTSDVAASGTIGRCVLLEVADDGPGIPADLRDRVFEPYFTTKTKGPERGTGLGLATVFGIAEGHHGSVEVDVGLDGRGTTLRVYLPSAATSLPAPATSEPRGEVAPTGSGTVLVVDDDPAVRDALVQAIEVLGYRSLVAGNGADAVAVFREHRDSVRVVLLDMVMPGLTGKATFLALRELDRDVRVLLMSGYTLNEEVQDILDLGVNAFLSKPYSVETLAGQLAELTR
jgi:two-component system, cell cycle sensor histidine kinase and response regulator CckA